MAKRFWLSAILCGVLLSCKPSYAQDSFAEAEKALVDALKEAEKLGPEHPDVGAALNHLAFFYNSQGKYDEAEPLLERSLAIWENALGPEHANVASALNNLAIIYARGGRDRDAIPLMQRALELAPQDRGWTNLGNLYFRVERYEEARKAFQRAIEIQPKCARFLGLADTYQRLGDPALITTRVRSSS